DDTGEDQLISDFGPGGSIRASTKGSAAGDSVAVAAARVVAASSSRSSSCFDPQIMLDRRITDEHGLRRRIVYDPSEIARVLQTRNSSSSSSSSGSNVCAIIDTTTIALDPDRPGCESLLICKAVTDAFLVNARRLRSCGTMTGGEDVKDGYLVGALRVAWQHAVEHWNGDSDEPHSAADLHVTAAWFQAWWAADDTSGGGEPTVSMLELYEMLPGDWDWVLDHLETTAPPAQGLHLDEELELERVEELQLHIPPENWGLCELKRALQDVSDEEWFQKRDGLTTLRLFGPNRASTFKRVFSNVPGAIYGCLKNQAGAGSTPPTFRMYTTGDIFEALGAEAVMRSQDVSWTGKKVEPGQSKSNGVARRRQEVSVVEIQVTWVGGCTHILAWLDS
ncbi:unnamed protein product, partial [Laminaria digitata]